ncbi:DUF1918 domain-containing protein [Amycolatopsis sp. NPDC004368]
MRARPGDWFVVTGARIDLPEQGGRTAEGGAGTFTVRRLADDYVSTVFAGTDAIVLTENTVRECDRTWFERLRAPWRAGGGVGGVRT